MISKGHALSPIMVIIISLFSEYGSFVKIEKLSMCACKGCSCQLTQSQLSRCGINFDGQCTNSQCGHPFGQHIGWFHMTLKTFVIVHKPIMLLIFAEAKGQLQVHRYQWVIIRTQLYGHQMSKAFLGSSPRRTLIC